MMKLSKQLKSDFNKCELIIKENSKTFYKAFSMLKAKQDRQAIYAIYAYCRVVDDAIDEYKDIDLLNSYESKLMDMIKGDVPTDFIFRSLNEVIKHYYPKAYDFKPYFDLIEGQRQDFLFTQPKTLDDLLKYCYHVAGVVGEMLSYVLAPKSVIGELKLVARNLGEAMQITNILRDIGEDRKRKRIYIPLDVMHQFNYTQKDLELGVVNHGFIEMFEYLANYAHKKYEIALEKLHLFKPDARKPLLLASKMYEEIIHTIRLNNYDVYNIRSVVSDERKREIVSSIYK
ncbi:squalene/phytoene synthase family protein [Acholeplasma laidlawii]|uniref:phytoene/squalene synthase family protein n=1 Tax=Acholeplasma laidlawii TaxID=2148 RepID=UPI0018C22B93|nr:phytoene/squalene synthase family protein [Acholeplasma laidlawii]MBG0762815.1 squalene/phytoene synthase family protein [Acholeplasma laidlawii]